MKQENKPSAQTIRSSSVRSPSAKKSDAREIPLSAPLIEADDIAAVTAVLRTNRLSLGPKLTEFEEKFARYIGTKHAIAVNSGTSALHLAIKALGIGPGDEVIVPPFTFVATANCALFEGATAVFADIDPVTFNIDPAQIEKKITPRTKAIIPVDVFGRPSDKESILRIARKHKLAVIEDSAEAIGAEYKGKKVGSFGDCAIFAFYPNKQMTTGEGGMLVTNDDAIASLVKSYRNQGRGEGGEWHEHVRIGYNFRLSDINCALGISQLAKIDRLLAERERVANEYTKRLAAIKGITTPFVSTKDLKVSWFVYVIQVENRDRFAEELERRGIACSKYFPPIHLSKFYRTRFGFAEGAFPVCESVSRRTLALPFSAIMTKEEVAYVCEQIAAVQRQMEDERS